jgi:hypothetical protein
MSARQNTAELGLRIRRLGVRVPPSAPRLTCAFSLNSDNPRCVSPVYRVPVATKWRRRSRCHPDQLRQCLAECHVTARRDLPFPRVASRSLREGELAMNTTPAADEIRRLPPVLTVVQAAGLLGIGRSNAYHAVKTDSWPTRVVRVGRCIRIPLPRCSGCSGSRQAEKSNERICLQALPVHESAGSEAGQELQEEPRLVVLRSRPALLRRRETHRAVGYHGLGLCPR